MANNQAIRILRGSYDNIKQNSNEKPLYGQPIFDKTNNYLLIGNQKTEGGKTVDTPLSELKPITTNRLVGKYSQYPYNSEKNKTYCIEPNVDGQKLNIITENGVNILDSKDGKAINSLGHLIAYGNNNIKLDNTNGIIINSENKMIDLKISSDNYINISRYVDTNVIDIKSQNIQLTGSSLNKIISDDVNEFRAKDTKIESVGSDSSISIKTSEASGTMYLKSNNIIVEPVDPDSTENISNLSLTSTYLNTKSSILDAQSIIGKFSVDSYFLIQDKNEISSIKLDSSNPDNKSITLLSQTIQNNAQTIGNTANIIQTVGSSCVNIINNGLEDNFIKLSNNNQIDVKTDSLTINTPDNYSIETGKMDIYFDKASLTISDLLYLASPTITLAGKTSVMYGDFITSEDYNLFARNGIRVGYLNTTENQVWGSLVDFYTKSTDSDGNHYTNRLSCIEDSNKETTFHFYNSLLTSNNITPHASIAVKNIAADGNIFCTTRPGSWQSGILGTGNVCGLQVSDHLASSTGDSTYSNWIRQKSDNGTLAIGTFVQNSDHKLEFAYIPTNGSNDNVTHMYWNPSDNSLTCSIFRATSDRRLKENIKEYVCEKSILDLPIYEFDYKNSKGHTIGCMAQDLQEICPQIVSEDIDGYLHIEESKIIYLLLEEVKKLKNRMDLIINN